MARRLITLAPVLSLILCIATVMLWAFVDDRTRVLRHGGGGIHGGGDVNSYALFKQAGTVGLGWTRSDAWFEGSVSAPLWLLVVVTASLPARRAVRLLNRGRAVRPGLCPRCGYDLRATPHRCPECGTTPERAP